MRVLSNRSTYWAARSLLVALSIFLCEVETADAQPLPATTQSAEIASFVTDASRRFGVPEAWIWAVMRAESHGNPRAISPAGAIGLMQIMPDTWVQLAARYQLGADPFDPHANILAGAAYLRAMVDRYGDLATALAAYNAGPKRVDDWRSSARPLPTVTLVYVAGITSAVGATNGLTVAGTAPVAAPDWHNAALFIARGDTPIAAPAPAPAPATPPTPAPAAPPTTVSAPSKPPVDTLFIPIAARIAR